MSRRRVLPGRRSSGSGSRWISAGPARSTARRSPDCSARTRIMVRSRRRKPVAGLAARHAPGAGTVRSPVGSEHGFLLPVAHRKALMTIAACAGIAGAALLFWAMVPAAWWIGIGGLALFGGLALWRLVLLPGPRARAPRRASLRELDWDDISAAFLFEQSRNVMLGSAPSIRRASRRRARSDGHRRSVLRDRVRARPGDGPHVPARPTRRARGTAVTLYGWPTVTASGDRAGRVAVPLDHDRAPDHALHGAAGRAARAL